MCVCICRKLRATLDEYTTRVGQQAIVLCISPSKPNPVFKVFGAAPLENVVSVASSIFPLVLYQFLRGFGIISLAVIQNEDRNPAHKEFFLFRPGEEV